MNYGKIKYNAVEDGIGCRTVLFVSGCRNHCPGCFQKETWDFNYGKPFDEKAENEILESLKSPYTRGLTLLGGEPFEPENQHALLPFIKHVKETFPDKDIWAYTGYTFEELIDPESPRYTRDTDELLSYIDILVDGKFIQAKADVTLPYRGSRNQRVLDLPESLIREKAVLSPYGERHRKPESETK